MEERAQPPRGRGHAQVPPARPRRLQEVQQALRHGHQARQPAEANGPTRL